MIHEQVDMLIFGRPFPKVHQWIDGTFNGTNARTHWVSRHHIDAIDKEYLPQSIENKVARLHVLVDWLYYYNVICIPYTSKSVESKLREHGVFIAK